MWHFVTDPLKTAVETLLEPSGLERTDIDGLLARMMSHQLDYADLYFQYSRHEAWSLDDGAVKSGSRSTDQGVGVRAISGEKTGFAYSEEFQLPVLTQAANAARAIAQAGDDATQAVDRQSNAGTALYTSADPLATLDEKSKIKLLEKVEAEARQQDPRVSQVMASLAGSHEVMLVARHDGSLVADVRPLVRLNVTVIVESEGRREQGSAGGGGRFGYNWLWKPNALRNLPATRYVKR